jgi:hypothetical protein
MDSLLITPKTEKRLALLFAPAEQERARNTLVEECGTNIPGWNAAGLERLRFAVLRLSDGRLDRLQAAVNNAKRDFRDVLMAADFGEPDS